MSDYTPWPVKPRTSSIIELDLETSIISDKVLDELLQSFASLKVLNLPFWGSFPPQVSFSWQKVGRALRHQCKTLEEIHIENTDLDRYHKNSGNIATSLGNLHIFTALRVLSLTQWALLGPGSMVFIHESDFKQPNLRMLLQKQLQKLDIYKPTITVIGTMELLLADIGWFTELRSLWLVMGGDIGEHPNEAEHTVYQARLAELEEKFEDAGLEHVLLTGD